MKNKQVQNWVLIVALIAAFIFIVRQCEDEPKMVTEIEYVTKKEPITQAQIDSLYELRPVIKGRDSIIYLTETEIEYITRDSVVYIKDSTQEVIMAKEYDAVVKTDSSRADLRIITTGELLDVKGEISWQEKRIETKIIKPKSGLYLYGGGSVKPLLEQVELGLLYQFRNKIFVGTSASYNFQTNQAFLNAKLGIKIF